MSTGGDKVNFWTIHFTLKRLPNFVTYNESEESFSIVVEGVNYPIERTEIRHYTGFKNASLTLSEQTFNVVLQNNTDYYTFRSRDTLCAFIRF